MLPNTAGIQDLREFLESYAVRPVADSAPPTLMKIAGFPHWENVYSNILAFFLDAGQIHGFGQLFIRSMLAAYCEHCPDGWPASDLDPEDVRATDEVLREVVTATGKRIDLLIKCADFLVCIENKIWSVVHNDLGDYRRHCEKSGERRPVLGIVLSPHRVPANQRRRTLDVHCFVNVTYTDLVEQLRRRLGNYIGPHNIRYQYLLFDFVEQADQFSRTGTMTDDQRLFLEFWRGNEEKIANIQSICDALQNKLGAKEKAQAHIDRCWERLNASEQEVFSTPWIWDRRVAVFDLADKGYILGCGVFLDVEFHPLRVRQMLGKRRGVQPAVLASRVSEKTKIDFKLDESSNRQVSVNDKSPFEQRVRDKAIEDSVKILKALAAIHFDAEDEGRG